MTWLDVMLVALLALSVYGGYRRGAVMQVFGLAGLVVGVVAGALLAPTIAHLATSPATRVALVLGAVIVGGAIGNLLGWQLATRLRSHAQGPRARRWDAALGSAVSVAALLAMTWFLALNLANGPFPQLARGIRDSRIVQGIDAVMPAPPSLLGEAQRVLGMLGLPDVFVGLPPVPADPVPPPPGSDARSAFSAAADSTFEILGSGCYQGFLNEGTGFVVRPELMVTNAHVVAGTDDLWVHTASEDRAAQVVAFDPALDIAILRVPGLAAPSVPLLDGEVGRGEGGAVLGFPGGGSLTTSPAAVRQMIAPVGRDIYGQGEVTRKLYEIQSEVRRGNSGGPFVLANGQVAGVVFANSVIDDAVGYAIASTEVIPLVRQAASRTATVGTGACTG